MGSIVKGNTIYISKDLAAKINPQERKIILAHEISHWKHRDNIKLFFINCLAFIYSPFALYLKRKIEARADREAIMVTKDIDAFVTLLEKLERNNNSYPSKDYSLQIANTLRGKLCQV